MESVTIWLKEIPAKWKSSFKKNAKLNELNAKKIDATASGVASGR